jgi:high-affinity Fe2+/Pb2+ permease
MSKMMRTIVALAVLTAVLAAVGFGSYYLAKHFVARGTALLMAAAGVVSTYLVLRSRSSRK